MRKRQKLYRDYLCLNARKRGWKNCPSKSINAGELERVVLEQRKGGGTDTGLVAKVLESAQKRAKALVLGLEYERQTLAPKIGQYGAELRGITLNPDHTSQRVLKRIAHLLEKIAEWQLRLKEIPHEIERLQAILKQELDQATILAQIDLVWSQLNYREQYQFLHLLIRRIDHDGGGLGGAKTGPLSAALFFQMRRRLEWIPSLRATSARLRP